MTRAAQKGGSETVKHHRAVIFGPAATQGSKKLGRNKATGKPLLLDTCARLKPWRTELHLLMRQDAPPTLWDCPVAVQVRIYVRRPLSHYRANGTLKPNAPTLPKSGADVDKCLRACLDAGTGALWRDDARVARVEVSRLYDDEERLEIEAWPLEGE